ncbi:hypothetical protein RND81_09G183300 [Saponaria officinalis]|uniref:Uncharacterized protein n=1 Tax=Saponaria officinalis TaxID=3572 RepID=A0AAW1INK0_SAPOF
MKINEHMRVRFLTVAAPRGGPRAAPRVCPRAAPRPDLTFRVIDGPLQTGIRVSVENTVDILPIRTTLFSLLYNREPAQLVGIYSNCPSTVTGIHQTQPM